MGMEVKSRCAWEVCMLFSASGVVTPKCHGERGLELICSVVGEAGWKLQLSMWEHAGGEESLKGKGKPGFKESCLKMTQRLYMMPLRHTNMHLHWSRNFKQGGP